METEFQDGPTVEIGVETEIPMANGGMAAQIIIEPETMRLLHGVADIHRASIWDVIRLALRVYLEDYAGYDFTETEEDEADDE